LSSAPSNREWSPIWGAGLPSIAGATHVGVVRRINQDAFGRFDDPGRGEILLVVADGLGGHRGGEVASRMAVDLVGQLVRAGVEAPAIRLTRAIEEANRQIHDAARVDYTLEGMGTTVVCLLLTHDGASHVAHVGDSRLYRLRSGDFEALTEDHSLVATLVREGVLQPDEARTDPRKNQILRALGVRKEVEVDVAPVQPRPGDTYLLCTDGLHGLIEDLELRELALEHADPEVAVEHLIAAANRAGGTDNVTCLLARLPEAPARPVWREGALRLLASMRAWLPPRRKP
jgi:PPM family protein phosphatase